jgi:hypothetical protein
VTTIRIEQLNAFELLNHRYLVVDRPALQAFMDAAAASLVAGKEVAR